MRLKNKDGKFGNLRIIQAGEHIERSRAVFPGTKDH